MVMAWYSFSATVNFLKVMLSLLENVVSDCCFFFFFFLGGGGGGWRGQRESF